MKKEQLRAFKNQKCTIRYDALYSP